MKIVIPAYEPDQRLLSLIQDINKYVKYEIVLVNDGSSKSCSTIFQTALNYGCTILHHTHNLGKGAALKTAFAYALEHQEVEGVICADCDGQHTWQDIKKIADALSAHESAIILGCRKFTGSVPFKSLLGNKITRSIYSYLSGNQITDTQTGLRGFPAHMLNWLVHIKGSRFEYEMNQLLEAKSAGYSMHCIPIDTIYENKNEGSHFQPIRDSIRIYLPIIKFSLSSISSGLVDFVLLLLFQRLTGSLFISVVSARVISSLCNYILNKKMVFHSKGSIYGTSLIKYIFLVGGVLICNFYLLNFFIYSIGLSLIPAKIVTELLLFFTSYLIQHKLIFHCRQL